MAQRTFLAAPLFVPLLFLRPHRRRVRDRVRDAQEPGGRGACGSWCTMFCLAALYVMLDAQFIGVMQVLVYAGAIMVVFVFVIMLLNLGHRRSSPTSAGWRWKLAAGVLGLALLAEIMALTRSQVDRRLVAARRIRDRRQFAPAASSAPIRRPALPRIPAGVRGDERAAAVAIVGAVVLGSKRSVRLMLAEALVLLRGAVHDRRDRRADAPQRDHRVHVRRAHAQRREPELRRLRASCTASPVRCSSLFVMTVAAAEAAVGLAIIIATLPSSGRR